MALTTKVKGLFLDKERNDHFFICGWGLFRGCNSTSSLDTNIRSRRKVTSNLVEFLKRHHTFSLPLEFIKGEDPKDTKP